MCSDLLSKCINLQPANYLLKAKKVYENKFKDAEATEQEYQYKKHICVQKELDKV